MRNGIRTLLQRGAAALLLGGFATTSANAFYFVDWPGSGQPPRRTFTPPRDGPPSYPYEPPFTDQDNPGSPIQPQSPDIPGNPFSPEAPENPVVPEPATLVSATLGLLAAGGWAMRRRRSM